MVHSCAIRGCANAPEHADGFCRGHQDEILTSAVHQLKAVLEVASAIYVGRSAFPERRLLEHHAEHSRDHLLVVHWAANWAEIERLEEALIASLGSAILRVENRSRESEGRLTNSWNALYVSFRLKARVAAIPGGMVVSQLHWRHRLWPDPSVPHPAVLLRSGFRDGKSAHVEVSRFRASTASARR